MSSSSKNDTSLCDLRKGETMRSNCLKYSVPYVSPDALQTARKLMQSTLATQKKRQQRAARLDEVKKAARIADVNRKRKAKAAQTDEVREAARTSCAALSSTCGPPSPAHLPPARCPWRPAQRILLSARFSRDVFLAQEGCPEASF